MWIPAEVLYVQHFDDHGIVRIVDELIGSWDELLGSRDCTASTRFIIPQPRV